MRRGTLLLLVGVGAPTAILAIGWMLASQREAEGRQREAAAFLQRTAEVVRGVIDASLEEMRLREDARPFDAYNHVYNPPGVVSLGDALALSPLARDPEDKRIVGYFQIDPGGLVRTPYERDPLSRTNPRARDVAMHVESPAFKELRSQAQTNVTTGAIASNKKGATDPDDGEGDETQQKPQSIASINTLQNAVYEELKQADQDIAKRVELAFEDRKVPVPMRNDVDWTDDTRGYSKKKPKPSIETAKRPAGQRRGDEAAPVVDYTPFVYDTFGDDIVLYRLVSSGGSRSVQGALLDRQRVFDRWLPAIIERHSVAATRPRIVKTNEIAECALRTEASDSLEGIELCFAPEAIGNVKGIPATEIGLLLTLVIVVAAAAVVTDLAARRADDLARQRGSFISAVSHELRTPLTTLRMHAELLRDGLVSEPKKRKFHDDMVQESVRLSHLVENVLEATRLEEGRRPLRAQRGDLGDAVRGIVAAQAPFVQTKGFTVEVETDDEVEATFDRQAVEQIVVNLLDNAAKYASDATEKVVRIEVRNEARPDSGDDSGGSSGRAVMRVLDRGPGIPSDELEKVFVRFHRVERPGQDHVVGTGLGLALVRELAQAHGGSAKASQRDGGGCCIEVRL